MPTDPFLMSFLENQNRISKMTMRCCESSMSNIGKILKDHRNHLTTLVMEHMRLVDDKPSYPINLSCLKSLSIDDSFTIETILVTPIFPNSLFYFFLDARNVEVSSLTQSF
jgi:hypothetical protein